MSCWPITAEASAEEDFRIRISRGLAKWNDEVQGPHTEP
jgi:hypothetical protein